MQYVMSLVVVNFVDRGGGGGQRVEGMLLLRYQEKGGDEFLLLQSMVSNPCNGGQ